MVREKVIFNGIIEGTQPQVQVEIDKFLYENFVIVEIDLKVELEGIKQLWVIYPPKPTQTSPLVNGYIEINPTTLAQNSFVLLRIVSCREELDILFFQLSQRLQARFIIPEFPSDIINIPLKKLIEEGTVGVFNKSYNDFISDVPDPDDSVPKFGTYRNLTKNQVRRLIKRCRDFQMRGGTVESFLNNLPDPPPCSLDTFRSWIKNPEFNLK